MASTTAKKAQDFQQTINSNANSLAGIYSGYDDIYRNYANGLVNDGSFQAIESARQNSQDMTNRQYNDAAKNYYTQYRQNQMALPEKLSNLGVTGGATESALLKLMNQYSGNLYQNQNARANALNNINLQYDQQIADNSKSIANQLAEIYLQLALQAKSDKKEAEEAAKAASSYSSGGSGGSYYYSDNDTTSDVAPSGTVPTVDPNLLKPVSPYSEGYQMALLRQQLANAKKKTTKGGSGSGSNSNITKSVMTYK